MSKYEISYNDKLFKEVAAKNIDECVNIVVAASYGMDQIVNSVVCKNTDDTSAEVTFVNEDIDIKISIHQVED